MPIATGDALLASRYRLGKLLGRGGMAEVFDGVDERLHRPVAVKLLRERLVSRPDVRQRFEDEARAAAGLVHPNVVAVYDTGEEDGVPFIVMERLPGETLADRMENGPIDPEVVRRVATEVLSGLSAAHDAGFLHRDVKPGNILIAADGSAKVADFGIAKSLEGADQTVTSEVLGTPAYLAPERIEGVPATVASDIYGLGVTLYEALRGEKPFTGGTPVEVATSILHDSPEPLAVIAEIPADIAAAVDRAMHRDPARRFESARAMAKALARTTGPQDATTVLSPVAIDSVALPRRRRVRWIPIAAGVALILALLIALVVAAVSTDRVGLPEKLRLVAASLDASDGARGQEAAARLGQVAEAVGSGGGAPSANALLADVAAWRAAGELSQAAASEIGRVLLEIPGTDPANLTPPTTAAPSPPTTDEDDKEGEEGREGGKRGKDRKGGDD